MQRFALAVLLVAALALAVAVAARAVKAAMDSATPDAVARRGTAVQGMAYFLLLALIIYAAASGGH